jgi:hypothetical protein
MQNQGALFVWALGRRYEKNAACAVEFQLGGAVSSSFEPDTLGISCYCTHSPVMVLMWNHGAGVEGSGLFSCLLRTDVIFLVVIVWLA